MDANRVRIVFAREDARALYAEGGGDFLTPATGLSAGFDLRACFAEESARIAAHSRLFIPAGVSIQPCSPDIAGFVYSRSGLGARDGLTVAQGVGIIDPDYTGEILVPLLNTSGAERVVKRGERIAQLVFQPVVRPTWEETARLSPTERGAGGFGHTGNF
ncbi:MAG: dUTP diphosphatase [Desulfovibrio sp.]|jgi:dUTP pyrophosphatase|nr:dUTP diphosphatase [Desulfovibrio sp.]